MDTKDKNNYRDLVKFGVENSSESVSTAPQGSDQHKVDVSSHIDKVADQEIFKNNINKRPQKKILPAKPAKVYSGAPGDLAPGPYKDLVERNADQIVNKHYQKQKIKPPFTQVAENAVNQLSFTMKDGFLTNSDDKKVSTVKEAIEINEALDENLLGHKTDDYLKHIEEKKQKQPFHIYNPVTRELDNVNDPNYLKPKPAPVRTNPTIEKYKKFKEDKKFNEEFEKEYGHKAMEKDIRLKEMANRRAKKFPYEDFTQSEIIIASHAKDRAKRILASINTPAEIDKNVEDISKKIAELQMHYKKREEDQIKSKREYDAVMNKPKDHDIERGLGSMLGIWKK